MARKIIPIEVPEGPIYNSVKERQENIIGSRIQQARIERGLSLTGFGRLLELSGLTIHRQGINRWETGGSVPNAYQLVAVCHALKIEDGINYFTRDFKKPERLNAEGRRKVEEYETDLIASGRYEPDKPEPVRTSEVTYIDMRISTLAVSAGTGAFLDDENFESMRFPAHTVPKNADFGVKVQGDSMEPVYHDGQIVWVQQCDTLRPGEVGVFIYDGDGYLKVYDEQEPDEDSDAFLDSNGVLHPQPVLVSYNEDYAPKVISPYSVFGIVGRVLN